MLALFAAIGLGYAVGQISVFGLTLGVGAVLFAGLALGAVAPGCAPPAIVSSIGLVMFLYGIGIQYGSQFFAGLRGPGLKWNLLCVVAVLCALACALVLGTTAGLSPAHAVGLFAGSLTSTPALQAAIEAAGNRDPAIGYSVAYPIGVVGPILGLFIWSRCFKPRLAPAPAPYDTMEITLGPTDGATVADVAAGLPPGVQIVIVRQGRVNKLPEPGIPLTKGDGLLLAGPPESLEKARAALGRVDVGRIASDRGELDVIRCFVSRPALSGVRILDLTFPDDIVARVVEVRRGDTPLWADPHLVLELGDRVTVLARRQAFAPLRRYFGDSIKSTTEFSYVSVGLGMTLGVLVGQIPIPLPGMGRFTLGLAGGSFVTALVLGRLGRTGPWSWRMPLPANLTLRNFGLTLFLAAVGLGAGAPFVDTVSRTGILFLAVGAATVLVVLLVVFLLGYFLLKMSTDDLFGAVSGATGNPAILAYANQSLASERIDVAYATIFPSATILKIVCAQVFMTLLS